MLLTILKAGVYNDAHGQAHRLQPGENLTTGLDYGQSLVASGFARSAGTFGERAVPVETVIAEPVPVSTPQGIDLSDGVDEAEAALAGKTLSARKKSKR